MCTRPSLAPDTAQRSPWIAMHVTLDPGVWDSNGAGCHITWPRVSHCTTLPSAKPVRMMAEEAEAAEAVTTAGIIHSPLGMGGAGGGQQQGFTPHTHTHTHTHHPR